MCGPKLGLGFQHGKQAGPVFGDQSHYPGRRRPLPREAQAARPKAQAIALTFDLCQSFPRSHRSTVKALPATAERLTRGVRVTASGSFLPFRPPRAPEEKEGFPSVSSVSPLPGGSP